MIVLILLDVGPVRHIKLLVDSKAPLLVLLSDSAVVFLGKKVVAVKCMAVGSL